MGFFQSNALLYKNFDRKSARAGLQQLRVGYVFEQKPYGSLMQYKIRRWMRELNITKPFGEMRDFTDDELREIYKDRYNVVEFELKKPAVFNTNIFYTYKEAWLHALNNNDIIASPQTENENRAISLFIDDYNKKNGTQDKKTNYLLGFYLYASKGQGAWLSMDRYIDMHQVIWRNFKAGEGDDWVNNKIFSKMNENVVAIHYDRNVKTEITDRVFSIMGDDEYLYDDEKNEQLTQLTMMDQFKNFNIENTLVTENIGSTVINPFSGMSIKEKYKYILDQENVRDLWFHGNWSDNAFIYEYDKDKQLVNERWDTHDIKTFCSNHKLIDSTHRTGIKKFQCLGHKLSEVTIAKQMCIPLHKSTNSAFSREFEKGPRVNKADYYSRQNEIYENHTMRWNYRTLNNFKGWKLIRDMDEKHNCLLSHVGGWMMAGEMNDEGSIQPYNSCNIIYSPMVKNLNPFSTVLFHTHRDYFGPFSFFRGDDKEAEIAIEILKAESHRIIKYSKRYDTTFMGIRDVESGKYVAYKHNNVVKKLATNRYL